MNTQALLVSRRILSRIDPGNNLFFLRLCYHHTIDCGALQQKTQMFNFSLFDALQLEILFNLRHLLQHMFHNMFVFFREKCQLPFDDAEREDLTIDNLLTATRLSSKLIYKQQLLRLEGRLPPDTSPPEVGTSTILSMIVLTAMMPLYICKLAQLDETYRPQVKQPLFQYNRFIKENPGIVSLLHFALIFSNASIEEIQLLLETGADTNAVDIYGNTPLHLLALNFECVDRTAKAKLLLDAGCHFDQVNANGETALSLSKKPRGAQAHPFVEIVPSLFCCCAQFIAKHKIPFEHEPIPPDVKSHVQLHVVKGPHSDWYSDYFKVQSP